MSLKPSVLRVLLLIHRRPEMYLGFRTDQRDRQLEALESLLSGYALAVHQHQLPNEELHTLAELEDRLMAGLSPRGSAFATVRAAMTPEEAWTRLGREITALAISQSVENGLTGIPDPVDSAFVDFRARARSRASASGSARATLTTLILDAPHRIAETLSAESAVLRLVFSPPQTLRLELSHGPPRGDIAGWLDLFDASLVEGTLADRSHVDLAEAIEYGLDLLFPRNSVA